MGRARGIALLEMVLATAILGSALVALGIAVGRCVWALSVSDNVQAALDLAEDRLAEWKMNAAKENQVKAESFEGERELGSRKFTWKQQIEVTEDPKIFQSTLTIQWKESGQQQEKVFVSLVPDRIKAPK